MSFDMVVQRFEQGDAAALSADAFEAVFRPYVDRVDSRFDFCHVRVPDGGEADLYTQGDGALLSSVMISRFSRGTVLDLLVEFVRRAEAVILPPGCPTMLIDEAQRQHLPDELRADAVVVSSGADIETTLSSC